MSVKTYQVSEEQIKEVIKLYKEKDIVFDYVISKLFPEYLQKDKPFCKIGQLLKRDQYPKNFYAVMKMKHFGGADVVRIVLINQSEVWENCLPTYELSRYHGDEITYGEFEKLCGTQTSKTFSIYKPC